MSSPPAAPAAASASRPEPEAAGPVVRRLKRRREFLAAARGPRWSAEPFVLQAVARAGDRDPAVGLGFTATRKLGGAVQRNLARRRLKEAARRVFPHGALAGHDYVLVARAPALTCAFTLLTDELARALSGLRAKLARGRPPAGRPPR
jgi:ribonuclease P protein component